MLSVAKGIAKGKAGQDFTYCMEESAFYGYENGYWKRLADLEIMRTIFNTYNGENNTLDISRFTIAKRNQILDNLKLLIFQRLECFNKNGYLNFDVGEYDPMKDFWHPHNKESYNTLRFSYPFESLTIDGMENPSAKCPLWIKTLDEVFEGNHKKIDILQEFFGYCLTRKTNQRKALLLTGDSNCGKSTILWILRAMIGDKNCSSVSINLVNNPQYTSNMMNKLANIDTDVSADAKSYEEQFKKITGGEPINCSPKYIPTFEFYPYCKIVLAANTFPRITDHSSAFYNRLILIPCERVFMEEEQNKDLPEQLKEELSGVFNWAVEGLRRLNKRGRFESNDFMKEAVEELRDESNPIDVFFRETIEIDKSGNEHIAKLELYNKYMEWCRLNGNAPMSNIKFGRAVYQKYSKVTEKKSQDYATGNRIWKNLKYKNNGAMVAQENLQWQD